MLVYNSSFSFFKAQNKSKATPCSTFGNQVSMQKRNGESNPQFDFHFIFFEGQRKKKGKNAERYFERGKRAFLSIIYNCLRND